MKHNEMMSLIEYAKTVYPEWDSEVAQSAQSEEEF